MPVKFYPNAIKKVFGNHHVAYLGYNEHGKVLWFVRVLEAGVIVNIPQTDGTNHTIKRRFNGSGMVAFLATLGIDWEVPE